MLRYQQSMAILGCWQTVVTKLRGDPPLRISAAGLTTVCRRKAACLRNVAQGVWLGGLFDSCCECGDESAWSISAGMLSDCCLLPALLRSGWKHCCLLARLAVPRLASFRLSNETAGARRVTTVIGHATVCVKSNKSDRHLVVKLRAFLSARPI